MKVKKNEGLQGLGEDVGVTAENNAKQILLLNEKKSVLWIFGW